MWRTAITAIVISGACFAQAPEVHSPREKLIEEIATLAAAEPPLLGIDTQTEAAKILMGPAPAVGRRFLDDALGRVQSLTDPPTVRALMFPAVELLYQHDPEEAVRLISAYLASAQAKKAAHDDGLLLDTFAGLIALKHPELAEACRAESEKIRKADPGKKEEIDKQGTKPPDVEGLNADERIALARKQKIPLVRIEMFLDVIDQKETPPGKRASLAAEVLPETEKLEVGSDDRLLSQSMLTRRLFEAGDRPGAAIAAQMLEQTFTKMYDCDTSACTSFKSKEAPGDMVRFFAEYLDENRISPADLGLTHRSLQVRMMLIELKKMIGEKK